LAATQRDIGNYIRVGITSTYLKFSHFACISMNLYFFRKPAKHNMLNTSYFKSNTIHCMLHRQIDIGFLFNLIKIPPFG
jgi:hypothetical protein